MSYKHRTLIVEASIRDLVLSISNQLPSAKDMWQVPLKQIGTSTISHYISAGMIGTDMLDLLYDPKSLSAVSGITEEQATLILSKCIVSEDAWENVLAQHGLELFLVEGINT